MVVNVIFVPFFFLEMGCSRPLHQSMHTAVLLKRFKSYTRSIHRTGRVAGSHQPTTTQVIFVPGSLFDFSPTQHGHEEKARGMASRKSVELNFLSTSDAQSSLMEWWYGARWCWSTRHREEYGWHRFQVHLVAISTVFSKLGLTQRNNSLVYIRWGRNTFILRCLSS
jgi:hypothetical protein